MNGKRWQLARRAVLALLLAAGPAARAAEPLRLVVMDPLARPLCCNCVLGLGQRDYHRLAAFLQQQLGRPVEVLFDEGLAAALRRLNAAPHLVIGKDSVVRFDAERCRLAVRPLAALSDRGGRHDLTGVFVVGRDSPARDLAALRGAKLLLGPEEDAESHAAALDVLQALGLRQALSIDTAGSTQDAALAVVEGQAAAAVVADYEPTLLVGCGKLEKDALRVVGATPAVPFVRVFATEAVDAAAEAALRAALTAAAADAELLEALESKDGFTPLAPGRPPGKPAEGASQGWLDWRGPDRAGRSSDVPRPWSAPPRVVWTAPLSGPALAGIAATQHLVVVPDKDADHARDVFRCFDAASGELRWQLEYDADEDVEYTNAPRAAPVIDGRRVYLQGALGDLHCLELETGRVVWHTNIVRQFAAQRLHWGHSSPPLLVDGRLIVNPGARAASLAALDPDTGKLLWQTPGHAAAYSAFITGTFGGRRQIIGYDAAGLGGWDPATGRRLWHIVPPGQSDFNVGTPLAVGGRILVATENNATRLYAFDQHGAALPEPAARNDDLAPDTPSPVVLGRRVFCTAYGELFCLDLDQGLKTLWSAADDRFFEHTNLVAGNDRVLLWTTTGDLLLIRGDVDRYEPIAEARPFGEEKVESMSHPALVGRRLYVRSGTRLACLEFE